VRVSSNVPSLPAIGVARTPAAPHHEVCRDMFAALGASAVTSVTGTSVSTRTPNVSSSRRAALESRSGKAGRIFERDYASVVSGKLRGAAEDALTIRLVSTSFMDLLSPPI